MGLPRAAVAWLLAARCARGGAAPAADAAPAAADGGCAGGEDGSCEAGAEGGRLLSRADAFWEDARRRGMQIRLRTKEVEEKAQPWRPAHKRKAMVLSDDVFYGRAILKIPRHALLSVETTPNLELRRELNRFLFEERVLEKAHNVTSEDSTHLLSLAYPLIVEMRDPGSVFREWLDAAQDVRLPVLELSERQRRVLKGTTVEGAYEEMQRNRDLIVETAPNLTTFHKWPVTSAEATWALAVIMRHARVVHPHQDVREIRDPRMYIFPIKELLALQLHPDPGVAISFQEEIILEEGKREEEMVLQIARRDMPKGEEIFLWPGRLSNSEVIVRHGITFSSNPIGIGRNVTQPPNWSPDKDTKIRREYDKYNCSTLESFELRFSPTGYPMRNFVRCYRVSWFLTNGWYSPALKNRLRDLNKWPPPEKYKKDDWLAWTQADAEVNRVIHDYCQHMRQQLKDTMDAATAEDFRKSKDPTDKLLWHLRGEESRTFKECLALAKKVKL